MKTFIITIFISIILILETRAQINYNITVSLDNKNIDKIYLTVNKLSIDSANVNDGKFIMKGTYKTQEIAFILIKEPFIACKIILDNGDYNVLLDTKSYTTKIESTSINHNLWINYQKSDIVKANKKAKDSLLNDFKLQIEKGKYDLSAIYLAKYHDIQLSLLNYFKELVNTHPDCYIIPYLLKGEDFLTQENFGNTFNQLTPEVRKNEWGQQFKAFLNKNVTTKLDHNQLSFTLIGSNVLPFASELENGQTFDLASTKGKWVLLDFWASWCAPCRAEAPTLKKAYKQFHNKNFLISSVSIDNDKANWKKAILEDQTLQFIHTISTSFGKTEEYKHYNVNSIPANFLINPEGIILDMDLRGEELINTLKKFVK
jgi:thiol-disulfide isomerase/thioredoxin